MSLSALGAYIASNKLVRKALSDVVHREVKKFRLKLNEGEKEKLYPGLTREKLPDSLAKLEKQSPSKREISVRRQGLKLSTDIAKRMWNEGITPKKWENSSLDERINILVKAKQIIGQEMLLSPDIRSSLQLRAEDNAEKNSSLSGVLTVDKNGKMKLDKPIIGIKSALLKDKGCEGALSALYHEMEHAAQCETLGKIKPDSGEAKHLKDYIGKQVDSRTIFPQSAKEVAAKDRTGAFEKAYRAEGVRHPGEVSEKAENTVLDAEPFESRQEFTTSIEMHADKIKDLYESMKELRYGNWKKLSIEQRSELLKKFENGIAKIENRKPAELSCEVTQAGVRGYYSSGRIVISRSLVNDSSEAGYKQTLTTLLHEGRHAYQFENINGRRTEPSDDLVRQWKVNVNLLGYQSAKNSLDIMGYYRYFTQPIEADARVFAETAVKKMGL